MYAANAPLASLAKWLLSNPRHSASCHALKGELRCQTMFTSNAASKKADSTTPARRRLRRLLAAGAMLGAFLASSPEAQASTPVSGPASGSELGSLDKDWVIMPAGAKQAYIGIHGGTVPVSLLTTIEGTSLVSFVGRTGNDFLELLHREDLRMPSLLNGTVPQDSGATAHRNLDLASFRVRHLMAGNATNSLPVIYLNGDSLAKLSSNLDALKPFGLSDEPLSIEGEIARPDPLLLAPRYHILVDPKYLQPRHQ